MTPPPGNGAVFTTGKLLAQKVTGPDVWAIIVSNFVMQTGTILEVEGDNPLAIVSLNSIVVAGDILVNSEVGGRTGPGSNPDTLCAGMQQAEEGKEAGGKGGGGGGGGFAENGKKGGKGNDANMSEGAGGKKVDLAPPTEVRGGCSGGNGGEGDGSGAGDHGNGGGAILLSARNDVTVSGHIQAGGAGGEHATDGHSGGGGGGSGGYIALEAPLITLSNATILAANGADASEGGGGGGGGSGFVIIHAQNFIPFLAVITPLANET